ncbi:MAG TPA: glycosyltransferase family 4 protein [Candidatus Limnocylindrales bacterium]|nr:glycosyltransferase family 4 protein [Candidatus Limnocylindrales bacterium]
MRPEPRPAGDAAPPGGSRRRLAMVIHSQYPNVHVRREALALLERGWAVEVFCLRGGSDRPEDVVEGVVVHRLPVRRRKGAGASSQLLEYAAFFAFAAARLTARHLRRRFDVVQVHNLPDFLVFAAAVPKLLGTPILLDLHDLMPEFYMSRFGRGPDSPAVRLVRLQERLACAFADRVITVTELWRRALVERGVPAAKVGVVMNLPDEATFVRPTRMPERADERFRLIYHGTFAHRYGIDVAIRAVARLRDELPVELIVHGVGEALPELRRLASELDVTDRVRFSTTLVPAVELPSLLVQADAGVVPYRRDVFTDGILPTKLLEYVALGIPAIVSRTPVVEQYFDDSMVRFVEPGDVEDLAAAIRELAGDPARRAALASAAARFGERHNWRRQSAEYAELVAGLADRRR